MAPDTRPRPDMRRHPPAKLRAKTRRRLAVLMLLAGLGLLGGLYLAHDNGWLEGGAASDVILYAPPEPPESQLHTGTGSARFSLYAPQYPGASVVEAARFDDVAGGTMMVVMTTPDDPVEVTEFYRSALADKGFRPRVQAKSRRAGGERTLVSGGRPSAGLDVMVSITKEADGLTRIELADNANLSTGDRR